MEALSALQTVAGERAVDAGDQLQMALWLLQVRACASKQALLALACMTRLVHTECAWRVLYIPSVHAGCVVTILTYNLNAHNCRGCVIWLPCDCIQTKFEFERAQTFKCLQAWSERTLLLCPHGAAASRWQQAICALLEGSMGALVLEPGCMLQLYATHAAEVLTLACLAAEQASVFQV